MIFDTNGVPVWWMNAGKPSLDFSLLPNGDVVWNYLDTTLDEEHRLDGSLARTVAPPGFVNDSHELLLLPNGDYLTTAARCGSGCRKERDASDKRTACHRR